MTSVYKKIFSNRHSIIPAIHVESVYRTLLNCEISIKSGADGVFLINHSISPQDLLEIHSKAHSEFPNLWIGVNCLGYDPETTFQMISNDVDGIWVDNAMINEDTDNQFNAEHINKIREEKEYKGLYFGGVSFKYQKKVDNLEKVSRIAKRYMDIVTTSGKGTGQSADISKIQRMKDELKDFPLAIASGITINNIDNYLDKADCFIVANGISLTWTELNAERIKLIVEKVKNYNK